MDRCKITLLCFLLLILMQIGLAAQKDDPVITKIEYFLDTDPSYGLAYNIPVTSSNSIDKLFTIDLNNISAGFHVAYIRAKDASGLWSFHVIKPFLKQNLPTNFYIPNIKLIEYFIDLDPGYGNGNAISIINGNSVEKFFTADISMLSNGFHVLYLRAKDANGIWSFNLIKPFLKQSLPEGFDLPDIVKMEYYIDSDPGYGLGQNVPINVVNSIDKSFFADLGSVVEGFHVLYLRVKNRNGIWSFPVIKPFVVAKYAENDGFPSITMLEYYIDADPGFGNAVSIALESSQYHDRVFNVPLTNTASGDHKIYVRAKNSLGLWSADVNKAFTTDNASGINFENLPVETTLYSNYPNPFNNTTSIKFALPKSDYVTLTIYNLKGEVVKQLANSNFKAGYHNISFNATGLSSGIYLYTLQTKAKTVTNRMLLVK